MGLFGDNDCSAGEAAQGIEYKTTADPCEVIKTKVLVLYNPAANSAVPYIWGTAYLAVQQLSTIWTNSQINNYVDMVACLPFNFSQTVSPINDVNIISSDASVAALRDQYKAEIVVMLVGSGYAVYGGTVHGNVKAIGGAKSDCFAVVNVQTATNGRYTFAHGVSHLFGGKHDNDNSSPSWARGKVLSIPLTTISFPFYSLMAVLPGGSSRLQHISNPNVFFLGTATGDNDRNNAQRVSDLRLHVADFYQDFGPVLNASVAVSYSTPNKFCRPDFSLTANHSCGTPPFTYQWNVHNGGSGWVPAGNSQTISGSFTVTPSTTFATKLYEVYIQDAVGSLERATATIYYRCPKLVEGSDPPGPVNPFRRASPGVADGAAGVSEVIVSPNPANTNLTVQLVTTEDGDIEVSLLDLQGRRISMLLTGPITAGQNTLIATLPQLAAGTYTLKLTGASINKAMLITVNQ